METTLAPFIRINEEEWEKAQRMGYSQQLCYTRKMSDEYHDHIYFFTSCTKEQANIFFLNNLDKIKIFANSIYGSANRMIKQASRDKVVAAFKKPVARKVNKYSSEFLLLTPEEIKLCEYL